MLYMYKSFDDMEPEFEWICFLVWLQRLIYYCWIMYGNIK